MSRRRRQFSTEFKLEAVRLAESGKPPGEVARELGIRGDMLRTWRREFAPAARPGAVVPGGGAIALGHPVEPRGRSWSARCSTSWNDAT